MKFTRLKRFFKFSRNFGIPTAFGYIIVPFLKKRKGLPYKHRAVKKYLTRWATQYVDLKSLPNELYEHKTTFSPIWVCWLQGEDNMPQIIRTCYDSIKSMAGNHPIVLITFDNIEKYVHIPATITQKLQLKQISYTHYADYLRVLLLKTYGGLWIDASIYATQPISYNPASDSFFTIKMPLTGNTYVSDYRWTVSLMGCRAGCGLFTYLELLFRKYIEDHNCFIDFFLLDYLIAILYDSNPDIRLFIDTVPINNTRFYDLESIMNAPFNENLWSNLIAVQVFNKLSWKANYRKTTSNGVPTFFAHIIK